ncbi:CapA family protein [Salirhabdus salicampi]|uniref:CapA family protein n=1 Tax=Salirhabdus salicampi TaxID=476102 RepID=UPI0020C284BD|nr:CapA family protein [Salirhabdus salicampi]MCP8616402.1 CapA family protein [Salirhabdus salicampi]
MKKQMVAIIVVIFISFITTGFFYFNQHDNEKSFEAKLLNDRTTISTVNHRTFESEISLGAVGDLLIHSSVYEDAKTSSGGYDFTPMLEDVKPYMEKQDIMFANQETILGGSEIGLSSYPRFNSPYEVGDALKDTGVDIVSIANNHTLDRGEQAILNATSYLDKIGIQYVGGYRSFEDQKRQRIINKNGIAVGFLAYTYGTNGLVRPNDKPYLVQYLDQEKMVKDIKALKPNVDFVVVSLHFGMEYQRFANDAQVLLADEISKAGADVIIGHHPHVLQPVDWLEQEDGHKTFIIYSLGNFLSGQAKLYQRIGAILELKLQKKIGPDGTATYNMKDAKVLPTWNHRTERYRDYKIVPLINADEYGLSNAKELYNEITSHMQSYSDNVEVVPELD